MKTTQKGSAAVLFVIVILLLLIAGAVFAYRSVANEESSVMPEVDTSAQQASVPAVVESTDTDSVDDISADIEASLESSDEDIEAMSSEFKQ